MNFYKKSVLLFILCIAGVINSFSQCSELITNGSFENAAFSAYDDFLPYWHSQIYQVNSLNDDEYLQAWQTRQKSGKNNNSDSIWVHSPDWFKFGFNSNGSPFHVMKERYTDNVTGLEIPTVAYAHFGNGYIGMTDAELVQQKVHLKVGKTYTLEMFIRPVYKTSAMGAYGGYYESSAYGWSEGAKFRAWLAADKIKYQHEGFDDNCTDDNDFFSTPLTIKTEILNLQINLSDFAENVAKTNGVYQWKKITAEFIAPGLQDGDQWLVIELAGNSTTNPCNVYLLIDDVSLKQGCTVECSRTDQCVAPFVRSACGSTEYNFSKVTKSSIIKISNLENVYNATLIIDDAIGQDVYTTSINCNNGILGDLYWDGRDNNNAPLAAGWYYITLNIENDCGLQQFNSNTEGFNGEIELYEPFDINYCPTQTDVDFICNEHNITTPQPCCYEQPDIYINNLSIGSPGTITQLQYIATNNIYLGPDVTIENDANVLLQAGNEILGEPFMEVEIGATVVAEIVPCPALRLTNPHNYSETANYNESLPDITNEKLGVIHSIDEITAPISIIPNPSANGFFHISGLPLSEAAAGTVSVYNILGEFVLQKEIKSTTNAIDISNYPKGIYFVQISSGDEISVQKIIYQ